MRIAIIGLSMLTLSACGAADSEFGTEEAVGPCGNIQAMLDARTEAEPFKRLRGVNKMMGDTPLSDTFIGMHKPFGAACTASVMNGFGAGTTIYTYSCPLFEGNSIGRDDERADAEAAFDTAASEMRACLGDGWETAEDTENGDYQVYHKLTYKPVDMADSASGFTVDPAFLEMSYTPFMRGRGGPPGWQVMLQFQAQVDTPAKE
jgi:hypothetical protein